MEIKTEAEEAKSYSRLTDLKGAISFHHVSFRYNKESDDVFTGLSFNIRKGQTVAITGSNGTGKASILKLIQSMHTATKGMIRIDGFDIRQLDAPHLRRQIAYVPKTARFFSGSILENLQLNAPLASLEEMERALLQADALDEVKQLSNGINTRIGMANDVKLSSDLAAKISLARAYLHDANILLIDELPNSLLSSNAGKNFTAYLQSVKGSKTVIFCTYREDMMQLTDQIIYLRGLTSPLIGDTQEILNYFHSPNSITTKNTSEAAA